MIDGVVIKHLEQIVDDRGRVMHMVKVDEAIFERFGEIYFSEILPGVVKAWKRHKMMTQLISVPIGKIRLVIYDDRKDSKSCGGLEVFEVGRDKYQLVKIPPRLWYGFRCISKTPALVANCTDVPHDPRESESISPGDKFIPFRW